MTPMTIGNFSIARKSTQGKNMLRMMWRKRHPVMVVLQPREVNSTCIRASVLHESIVKYMWFQIRKNHIFYTVAVCSISISIYIYHTQDVNTKTPT